MVFLRNIRLILTLGFISAPILSTAKTTLAVLDFENHSFFNKENYESLSKGLAEMMITELSQVQAVQVVERQRLRTIMDEINLSQSGMVAEESSAQVGKLLGAHHLVFGSFMVNPGEKIRIDLRIVKVETGELIKGGEVTGKTKDILTLIKKMSKKILKDLNVQLSGDEASALGASQKLDMQAVLHFSTGLEYEDKGELKKAGAYYKKAIEIEPNFQQARKAIQRLLEKLRNQ